MDSPSLGLAVPFSFYMFHRMNNGFQCTLCHVWSPATLRRESRFRIPLGVWKCVHALLYLGNSVKRNDSCAVEYACSDVRAKRPCYDRPVFYDNKYIFNLYEQ